MFDVASRQHDYDAAYHHVSAADCIAGITAHPLMGAVGTRCECEYYNWYRSGPNEPLRSDCEAKAEDNKTVICLRIAKAIEMLSKYFEEVLNPSHDVSAAEQGSGQEYANVPACGTLHGLRKFEDFHNVLLILDLVKGKFPSEIPSKLHDLEFQLGEDFDAVMRHLDNIIALQERYEDPTTLSDNFAVNTTGPQRKRTST
ncbi:unnamed protein product [Heligmosomoides polygyrus]|uniref:Ferritin n=1 Tax=Heligmosomoides polygyrus TaxID=6339 RepID=A0A183GK83_HELPZ|nr:unnamed protein product [Heligmosomoides polygyrus]